MTKKLKIPKIASPTFLYDFYILLRNGNHESWFSIDYSRLRVMPNQLSYNLQIQKSAPQKRVMVSLCAKVN